MAPRLPLLIQQSLIDAVSTGAHANDAEQNAALAAWRQQSAISLVDVRWPFSGDVAYHVLVDPEFGDFGGGLACGPAGSTLGELLGRFWAGGAAERIEF